MKSVNICAIYICKHSLLTSLKNCFFSLSCNFTYQPSSIGVQGDAKWQIKQFSGREKCTEWKSFSQCFILFDHECRCVVRVCCLLLHLSELFASWYNLIFIYYTTRYSLGVSTTTTTILSARESYLSCFNMELNLESIRYTVSEICWFKRAPLNEKWFRSLVAPQSHYIMSLCIILGLRRRLNILPLAIKCCSRISICQKIYLVRWLSVRLYRSMIGFQSVRRRTRRWEFHRLTCHHRRTLKAFPLWTKTNLCLRHPLSYWNRSRKSSWTQPVDEIVLLVKAQTFKQRWRSTTFRYHRQPFQCVRKSVLRQSWP